MTDHKDQFQTTIGTDGLKNLRFDSTKAVQCCRFAVDNNIKKVTLLRSDYKAKDLAPLLPLKDFIESIFIMADIDLSLIHEFNNLRGLSLDKTSQKINLDRFSELTTLCCVLTSNIEGLANCKKLNLLYLSNFKSSKGDLTILPELSSLTSLGLFKTQIASLDGIEKFQHLVKLNIYSAPNLVDISKINELTSVEEIEFELCKRLADYSPFSKLKKLKKLLLSKCGEISSLNFISSMTALNFLSFVDTNVKDGDLSFCKGLDYVGFMDKKHYNLKHKDLNKPRGNFLPAGMN